MTTKNTTVNMPNANNPKFMRLAGKIIDDINPQYKLTLLESDKRMRQLMDQKKAALKEQKFLKVQIIERQLMSRAMEIECDVASRRLHELCEKGGIEAYLDKEDHDRMEALTAMAYIMLDALDSVCIDIFALYDSYSLAPEELYIQRFSHEFREHIAKWMARTNVSGTPYEEPVRQEGDRLYIAVQQRQEVLFRKIDRIRKKQEQHDNDNEKEKGKA